MNTYVTSDLHFGHKLMAELRKFQTVEEMDLTLVSRINSVVTKQDRLFILGDVSFHLKSLPEKMEAINCKNVVLIYGNHDKNLRRDGKLKSLFSSCHDLYELKHNGHKVVMFHYPMAVWNAHHYGSFHFHGHSHGKFNLWPNRRIIDVGVDCFPFPQKVDDLIEVLSNRSVVKLESL